MVVSQGSPEEGEGGGGGGGGKTGGVVSRWGAGFGAAEVGCAGVAYGGVGGGLGGGMGFGAAVEAGLFGVSVEAKVLLYRQ